MERGSGEQSRKVYNKKRAREDGEEQSENFTSFGHGVTYKESPETLATLANIRNRGRRRLCPGSFSTFHDNTSQRYGWLVSGWLAEERIMNHGRVYRV
ncbi:hypothetical protein P3X46_014248 [Hevea brasiliensis]|uniref:Uncharacterized protein n=1 Tax=Hevea brasiliensis TaxID=3981 RepID=A0ABQ9M9R4_HEVBR|nr:hypothetical protein P3X46_014248 [Hevea brasiliensis]